MEARERWAVLRRLAVLSAGWIAALSALATLISALAWRPGASTRSATAWQGLVFGFGLSIVTLPFALLALFRRAGVGMPGASAPRSRSATDLVSQLRSFQVDWRAFQDRARRTLALLELDIPLGTFATHPSAETLVATSEAVGAADRQAGVELRAVCFLAMLDGTINQIVSKSRSPAIPGAGTPLGFPYLDVALPLWIKEVLDRAKPGGSRFTPQQWVAAYLSAYAGQGRVLGLDEACRVLATVVSDAPAATWSELQRVIGGWKGPADEG
jgi:hypothetical protein